MYSLVPLAYAAFALIQYAPSENGLKGFEQFTFGMSTKEASKLAGFDSPEDLDHGYARYSLRNNYRILGVGFNVSLYFKEDVFSFVTLDGDSLATVELCQRRFSAIMGKIVRNFGFGNGHPAVEINGSPGDQGYFETRRFDTGYLNGTNVQFSTTFNGSTCHMSIVLQGELRQLGF